MFEAAVDDGPEDFRLEEEVSEAGAVDGDVGALHLLLGSSVGSGGVDGNLGLNKNEELVKVMAYISSIINTCLELIQA